MGNSLNCLCLICLRLAPPVVCACLRVCTPVCSCQFLDAVENTSWPLSGRPGGGWPLGREGPGLRNTAGLGTPESGRLGG